MGFKYSYEEIKSYIEGKNGNGCKLLSTEFINVKEELLCLCKCGNEFKVTFDRFKHQKKNRCGYCSTQICWNYEMIKRYIEVDSGSECKLLSTEYVRNDKNLELQCKCGNVFITTFARFKKIKQYQCKNCSTEALHSDQRLSYDSVKQYIEIESNSGCKLLSKTYKKNTHRLEIMCKCGNVFFTSYNKFRTQNHQQCKECGLEIRCKARRVPYNIIKNYIEIESDSSCKLITTEIKSVTQKLKIVCKCGNIFYKSFSKFKTANQQTCPCCAKSKGEISIEKYLIGKNIQYKPQYSNIDCIYKKALPFDFAIIGINDNILCLIEYDGEQHFKPVAFGGIKKEIATINFEEIKIRDQIKNDYCQQNNITLIRIPYWEFDNIEQILAREFNKLNIIS